MFSIVIPAYRRHDYSVEALVSCLGSPLVSEVLIASDAPPGAEPAVSQLAQRFAKLKDLSAELVEVKPFHDRLNHLVRAASGEWIAVLEADDLFGQGRFAVLKERMRRCDADLFFGTVSRIDRHQRHLGTETPVWELQHAWPAGFAALALAKSEEWLPLLLHQNCIVTISNMVFSRALFEEIGGFRNYRYAYDWDFALRAAALRRIGYAPDMVTYRRIDTERAVEQGHSASHDEISTLFAHFYDDFPHHRQTAHRGTVGVRSAAASTFDDESVSATKTSKRGKDLPDVSILIPVHNRVELTRACLESIFKNAEPDIPSEIIVVDDCSTDGTADYLNTLADRVRVIRNEARGCFGHNMNTAAAAALGTYLVFLNNDTEVTPRWLRSMLDAARSDPTIGVIGNRQLYPDSHKLNHAGMVFDDRRRPVHLYPHKRANFPAANFSRDFQSLTGACLLMPRAVFNELEGFDPAFRNGHEDVDLCLRARRRGYRVHYVAESVIYHHIGATAGRFDNEGANERHFVAKWYDKLVPDSRDYIERDRTWLPAVVGAPRIGRDQADLHLAIPLEFGNAFSWVTARLALACEEAGLAVSLMDSSIDASISGAEQARLRRMMERPSSQRVQIKWAHYWEPYRAQELDGRITAEIFVTNYRYGVQPVRALDQWMRGVVTSSNYKLPVSRYCRDALTELGVAEDRCSIVPHGYSPEVTHDIAPDERYRREGFVFLALTNSADPYRYGTDILLAAWGRAFAGRKDVVLVLKNYGGKEHGQIEAWLRQMPQWPKIVHLSEFVSKEALIGLYRGADAFVAPFRGEGFAMKVLDAAAVGLPIIAPMYGGPADYLKPGEFLPLAFGEVPVGECLDRRQTTVPGFARWAEVEVDSLVEQMVAARDRIDDVRQSAASARDRILEEYSWRRVVTTLVAGLGDWEAMAFGATRAAHPAEEEDDQEEEDLKDEDEEEEEEEEEDEEDEDEEERQAEEDYQRLRWRLLDSGLFDANFYCAQNGDIQEEGIDPLDHYIHYGAEEARDPSAAFDTARYLAIHPAAASGNPLLHYLEIGHKDERSKRAVQSVAPPPKDIPWEDWLALADRIRALPPAEPQIDVIVPVYRGITETANCLYTAVSSRLVSTTPVEVVVIDDCTPEPEMAAVLDRLTALGLFSLLRNDSNLGFAATVNRGMALHGDRDVVLLNADTEVYGDWIDRLHTAATASPFIGTVTPFSNNATICSYPQFCHDFRFELEMPFAELDRLASRVNRGRIVDIPTGVGFCLYIRRHCLDQVGLFDVENFGRGYGEENDFCLRGAAKGWRNILAGDVYVRHLGRTSFGGSAWMRQREATAVMERLHPYYMKRVDAFVRSDPVKRLRRRLDIARLRPDGAPAIAMVSHDIGGGTEMHIADLCALLKNAGVSSYLLYPAASGAHLAEIGHPSIRDIPNIGLIDLRHGLADAVDLLRDLGVFHLHIHHLLGFSQDILYFLPAMCRELGIGYDFTFHDYLPVCPRVFMIDGRGIFCGKGDELAECEACIRVDGSEFGNVSVGAWRADYEQFLLGARRLFAPNEDGQKRLQRLIPGVDIAVRRHPEQVPARCSQPLRREAGEPLRVAIIGNITPHKGLQVLKRCAEDAALRRLPITYVLFGAGVAASTVPVDVASISTKDLDELPNLQITGEYEHEELPLMLAAQPCHIAFLPSVCPESYSFVLSDAFFAGLFPVAFDIGAPAQRIRDYGWGLLLPFSLVHKPSAINDALLSCDVLEMPDCPPPVGVDLYQDFLADYYEFEPGLVRGSGDPVPAQADRRRAF